MYLPRTIFLEPLMFWRPATPQGKNGKKWAKMALFKCKNGQQWAFSRQKWQKMFKNVTLQGKNAKKRVQIRPKKANFAPKSAIFVPKSAILALKTPILHLKVPF